MPFFRYTSSKTTNFRLFQTKEVADDNFKFDINGRKFSKWVENTARKGEIARYEQFLLFPQCFQNTLLPTCKKQGLFGKGLMNHQKKGYHCLPTTVLA